MSETDRIPRWSVSAELRRGSVLPVAWKLRRRLGHRSDVGCMKALGVVLSQPEIDDLLIELVEAPELAVAIGSDAAAKYWGTTVPTVREVLALDGHGRGRALFLYVLVRAVRPSVLIETGCFSGWDSTVLLTALQRNGHGSLTTIDLPPQAVSLGSEMPSLKGGLEPGFLVPDELRSRWELRVADVREELPGLLRTIGEVDLFFHDSDHSYTHVLWELTSAWQYLGRSGVIVVDDVSWNTAVWEFARGVGAPVALRRGSPNIAALATGGGRSA